jgi:hypothetical protein
MRFCRLAAAVLLLSAGHGQAQTPSAPPRNVADILAVLDQYKPDPVAVEKLRAQAEVQPPVTKHEQELAVFFHKRARANENLGRFSQQTADLYC